MRRWLISLILGRATSPYVSDQWLREQDRRESRIEFHGAVPRWPIKKLLNESPIWNANKLRKSA